MVISPRFTAAVIIRFVTLYGGDDTREMLLLKTARNIVIQDNTRQYFQYFIVVFYEAD